MKGFVGSAAIAVLIFLVTTGEYIALRILLPGMSLTVPNWWAVFWANIVLGLFVVVPAFIIKTVAES